MIKDLTFTSLVTDFFPFTVLNLEALKKSVTMDTLSAKNRWVCYYISRTLIGNGQYVTNVTPLKLSTVNENFMLLMM